LAVRLRARPAHSCAAAGSTERAARPGRLACRRSSGSSGVIWSLGRPPGSHHPQVAPGRDQRQLSPSTPCRQSTIADGPGRGRLSFAGRR